VARSSADNAAMESFFALLQKDVLDQQRWATCAELRLAIVTWIEKTYHRTRRQRHFGRLSCATLRKPWHCSARRPGELAGDDELPHMRGRRVAEPRMTTLAPGRRAHGCRFAALTGPARRA